MPVAVPVQPPAKPTSLDYAYATLKAAGGPLAPAKIVEGMVAAGCKCKPVAENIAYRLNRAVRTGDQRFTKPGRGVFAAV